MQRTSAPAPDVARIGRAAGNLVAAAIDLALLYVVRNILEWGWLGFLTDDFATVVPWISVSLVATAVGSLIAALDERPVIGRMVDVMTAMVSMLATVRLLGVFPFDFDGYGFDWSVVVRAVLILAIVGTLIGILANLVRLAADGAQETGPSERGWSWNR